jgi:hypothetical protein
MVAATPARSPSRPGVFLRMGETEILQLIARTVAARPAQ